MAARRGKSQAKRNGATGRPAWTWLVAGILIGILAIGAWQLRGRWTPANGLLPQPDPNAHAPAATSEPPIAPEPERPHRPTYDFYTILPGKEVEIPDADLAAQAEAEARQQAAADAAGTSTTPAPGATATAPDAVVAAPAASGTYVLQAGAFRGQDDAEALKARIALTGEVARVESAQINGTTVYRVRMGPYASAGTLAAAKQALVSHGIAGAQAISVK
jgi:cell division protein FtsN